MSEDRTKAIFSKNLKKYMHLREKSQADLAKVIGVSSSTASDWCNGRKMPRSDKLAALCQWLGIELNELMAEDDPKEPLYYLDIETARAAQEIFANKDLRMLFDIARDADPEDLRALHSMALALKRKERGNDD